MNCLIIDDNPKTSDVLADQLRKLMAVTQVYTAVQPYQVRSLMAAEKVDIIFIRVRLWNPSVFERLQGMPVVVFLCGGRDKLTDKPGTSVPYRLREPYHAVDIQSLIRRIEKEPAIEPPAFFFVRYEGRFHRIFFHQIEMVERLKMSFIKIYFQSTSLMFNGSLPLMLKSLPPGEFIRVSDTLILPLGEAKKIEGDCYVFKGREIKLTFRFALAAKKELEMMELGWY